MQLYHYRCDKCSETTTAFRKVADLERGPICCERAMKNVIRAPMIQPVLGGGDFQGYDCPVSGQFVNSRKQRREIMSEHRLSEKE